MTYQFYNLCSFLNVFVVIVVLSVLLSHFKCNFISLLVLISFILLFLASKLSFFKKI